MPAAATAAVSTKGRTRRKSGQASPWRNRIVGHGEEAPTQLVPNERNWRRHPPSQRKALAGALAEIGWVQQVVVNRTTGRLVDGHLRLELALVRAEPTVPVPYVELTADEERVVLATFDPIAALAEADTAKLAELLRDLAPAEAALSAMLAELAERHGIVPAGLTDADDVPPLPDAADVYVQPDELWQLGEHRLLCADVARSALSAPARARVPILPRTRSRVGLEGTQSPEALASRL